MGRHVPDLLAQRFDVFYPWWERDPTIAGWMCFPEVRRGEQLLEGSGVVDACSSALQDAPSGTLRLPPRTPTRYGYCPINMSALLFSFLSFLCHSITTVNLPPPSSISLPVPPQGWRGWGGGGHGSVMHLPLQPLQYVWWLVLSAVWGRLNTFRYNVYLSLWQMTPGRRSELERRKICYDGFLCWGFPFIFSTFKSSAAFVVICWSELK